MSFVVTVTWCTNTYHFYLCFTSKLVNCQSFL